MDKNDDTMIRSVESAQEKINMARGQEEIFPGDNFDVLFDSLETHENEICHETSQEIDLGTEEVEFH